MKKIEWKRGDYKRKSFLDCPCWVAFVKYNHTVALMYETNQSHLQLHFINVRNENLTSSRKKFDET